MNKDDATRHLEEIKKDPVKYAVLQQVRVDAPFVPLPPVDSMSPPSPLLSTLHPISHRMSI